MAIKQPGTVGRPMLFTDPSEFSDLVDKYFTYCDTGYPMEELNKRGDVVQYTYRPPYSVEGLSDYLGCDPSTLRDYAKKDEFSAIISRAMNKIHRQWVERGLTGQYNPKMAALCLAANTKTYNISKQVEHNTTITIEDKIREARTRKLTEYIPDAEVIEQS